MHGLLTDLYQLTMAAGYFEAGKQNEKGTFELFLRRLPPNRNYVLATGLAQAVDYLLSLSFTEEEIGYLRTLPQFANASPAFFEYLRRFRFTGELFAVPEGTPVFPGEPILTLRAPLIEAQIPETFLLAVIGFQSSVATKAARAAEAAEGRAVIEFGTRRAHSPEAGVLAGRAAYIGGCLGTSNTLTGFRFGVPVYGTAAHSWVQSFQNEEQAFLHLRRLLGEATIYLIDTYDTINGAMRAAALGKPLWGVRLDSGDLAVLSRQVRRILDDAGLTQAKIMASGDLNEYRIQELVRGGAPIDSFGVGTDLATSADAPSLSSVYKLVEMDTGGIKRFTAKYSSDKLTMPGSKQIFRFADRDVIGGSWECVGCPTPENPGESVTALQQPVLLKGELLRDLPDAAAARQHAANCVSRLPERLRSLEPAAEPWPVEFSAELKTLAARVRCYRRMAAE